MYFQIILTAGLAILPGQVFGGVILRDAEDSEICESEDCHYTANHILKWLNPEVDPCDDFYEFVCGNWQKLPVDQRANMSLGARDSLVERYVPGLIKDPSTTNGNKHFENLRNFLITCMDEDAIHSLGVTPIKQLIQKAGGWPVLDTDWSEEDWDFINAEVTLGGVLIDVDANYYSDENSSDITAMLYLGRSALVYRYGPDYEQLVEGLKNETTKVYYDEMVEVAVALGADRNVAEKAMKEVLEFETAFFEELRHITNNLYKEETTTLKETQEEMPWIDLTRLLEAYLPATFELLPEEKIIARKDFFNVLGKFFKQYPRETFVNYMVSKAVYPLLDYVSHNINISKPKDVSFGYGDEVKEETRFEFCTKMVSESSGGPAMAAYLGIKYNDASKVASEMTKVIIEELSKEVEEADWLDEVTRREGAKNISEIKIDVGFPPKILDLELLDEVYEGYETEASNFFETMVEDKKWIKRREFDRLQKSQTADSEVIGWRYYTVKGLSLSAQFDSRQNSIDVSGPMLYFTTLFSPENPAYVNYGHVGTIVAHELIHAVDVNAAPGYFLDMEKWGSNRTEQIYEQKKQCFIDFYSSFNDTKTMQKLNGNYTQREDMADNGGIKLSLRAYRKFADQLDSPERKLPRLQQYSIEQLFMISVANSMCEIPYKEQRIMQLKYDPHSPFEFRVKGMMMNSPDFSEIFNCDKKDTMNPPDKCEVW